MKFSFCSVIANVYFLFSNSYSVEQEFGPGPSKRMRLMQESSATVESSSDQSKVMTKSTSKKKKANAQDVVGGIMQKMEPRAAAKKGGFMRFQHDDTEGNAVDL